MKRSESVLLIVAFATLAIVGCTSKPPAVVAGPVQCFPGWSGSGVTSKAIGKPFIGGLKLGDFKAKRLAAKRILKAPAGFEAPEALDNSAYVSGIQDQGELPECAAYSQCAIMSASYWRSRHVKPALDPHALYEAAKRIDNDPLGDGTTLEAVMSVASTVSVAKSGEIPSIEYETLVSVDDLPYAIHKYGWVWVGMNITEDWSTPDRNGLIRDGGRSVGGHAVVVVGYSIPCRQVKILNSWGNTYGDGGFCYLSFDEFEREFGYGYSQNIKWEAK